MPQRKRDWADTYLAAQGVKTAPFFTAALACPMADRAEDNPDTRRTSPRAASQSRPPEISEQQLLLQRRAAFDTARCIAETANSDRSADLGVDTRRAPTVCPCVKGGACSLSTKGTILGPRYLKDIQTLDFSHTWRW